MIDTPPPPDALLPIPEVARRCGVTRDTIYRWYRDKTSGLIFTELPNGRLRVAPADLDTFLQGSRTT